MPQGDSRDADTTTGRAAARRDLSAGPSAAQDTIGTPGAAAQDTIGTPGAAAPVAVPDRWRRMHFASAAAVTLAAVAAGAVWPDPALPVQLAVTAAAVGLLGLPHGAVDHLYGRARFAPRFGRAWPAVFAAGYLGLAALVVALWLVVPAVALIGSRARGPRHFGAEDAAFAPAAAPGSGPAPPNAPPARPEPAPPEAARASQADVGPPGAALRAVRSAGSATWAGAEVWARGVLPILLPVALHPAETGRLFAWLLPGSEPASVAALLTAGQPATAALALVLVLGLCGVAAVRRRWPIAAEVALLTAMFAALPPLLGFAVYFCFWHAPRHSLRVIADHHPGRLARGLTRFARSAAALTAATAVAAGLAWVLLAPTGGPGPAATRVLFIGLAALTLPHAALHAGAPRRRAAGR